MLGDILVVGNSYTCKQLVHSPTPCFNRCRGTQPQGQSVTWCFTPSQPLRLHQGETQGQCPQRQLLRTAQQQDNLSWNNSATRQSIMEQLSNKTIYHGTTQQQDNLSWNNSATRQSIMLREPSTISLSAQLVDFTHSVLILVGWLNLFNADGGCERERERGIMLLNVHGGE